MRLSTIVGATALLLAGVLVTGHAFGEGVKMPAPAETAQQKVEEREVKRRAAMAEHQKRKEDFARRCIKPDLTETQLEACRVAYRRL